jgi:hypothetical protein
MNTGALDFVVPMFYLGTPSQVSGQIREAQKYVKKGAIYAGLGVWNQSTEATLAEIDVVRQQNLPGMVLFSYDTLADTTNGLVQRLASGPFRRRNGEPVSGPGGRR